MSKSDLRKIALNLYLDTKGKVESVTSLLKSLIHLKDLSEIELKEILDFITRIENHEIEIVNIETPSRIKDEVLLGKIEQAIKNKIEKDFIINQVISNNFNRIIVKVGDKEMHI
jgi:L-cysteine desulfidase